MARRAGCALGRRGSAGEPRAERGVALSTYPLRRPGRAARRTVTAANTIALGPFTLGPGTLGTITLGTIVCTILSTVPAGVPAQAAGGPGPSTSGTRAVIETPPVGIQSLAYYRVTADERAEVRELDAASRSAPRSPAGIPEGSAADASVAVLVPPVVAGAAGAARSGTAQSGTARSGTVRRPGAGKDGAGRSGQRTRPAPKAGRPGPAATRSGPGRQRTATQRTMTQRAAPRSTAGTTWAAGAAGAAGNGGGVVGFALAQVGKGYGFGSVGPEQFDCSGLVAAAYRRIGIPLPHQTGALAGIGRPVGRGDLRPGDLVFPSESHVGIYIGNGRIVHASTESGGVKISPIYAFRFARRIG